jgi:hypothetical protein
LELGAWNLKPGTKNTDSIITKNPPIEISVWGIFILKIFELK